MQFKGVLKGKLTAVNACIRKEDRSFWKPEPVSKLNPKQAETSKK